MNYLDLRVRFQAGQLPTGDGSALQIRNLPWNSYFTVMWTDHGVSSCASAPTLFCKPVVGSPAGSPLLANMQIDMGNGRGASIVEFLGLESSRFLASAGGTFHMWDGIVPVSTAGLDHQHLTAMSVTEKESGGIPSRFFSWLALNTATNIDRWAGSTLSATNIPNGEYRAIPRAFLRTTLDGAFPLTSAPPDRPDYFHYVTKDGGGVVHHLPVKFAVVGDATTSLNAGLQLATCGSGGATPCSSLRFDNIWSAFRVNQPAGPQALPTINIGANVLQITATPGPQPNPLISTPITNFMVPWPRMIWRGETGF